MSEVSTRRSRLGLITLAVLFLGPMFAAYFAYQNGWRPGGETAKGYLLSPARPAPSLSLLDLEGQAQPENLLRHKWTMLYVGNADCTQSCQQTLYNMRQVWKSLGRRSKRVQGVYLLADQGDSSALEEFLAAEHEGLSVARPVAGEASQWLQFFSLDNSFVPLATDNVYILDPLGNWVLMYKPEDEPKGILKDLKKLLRLSQIG